MRVAREYIDLLLSSLPFIQAIQKQRLTIKTLHCSGTIKKIERKARDLLIFWCNKVIKAQKMNLETQQKFLKEVEGSLEDLKDIET